MYMCVYTHTCTYIMCVHTYMTCTYIICGTCSTGTVCRIHVPHVYTLVRVQITVVQVRCTLYVVLVRTNVLTLTLKHE